MEQIEKGYRIPTEKEFVQDFKFEFKREYRFGFLDLLKEGKRSEEHSKSIVWIPCKVTWKKTKNTVIEHNDYTYIISPEVNNFFKPFNVKSYLDQGLIRVKI